MLAYHFPPLGGAGVQRLTQLARRLPELGWEPIVVTGPGEPESHWRPRDESVIADDLHVAVHRLPAPEPPHDVRWEARLERWVRLPQRWQRWWSRHVREVSDSVGGHVDLVHASVAPYSTADSAVAVARRLGKPLLLDLEDPWALDEMLVYPTRVHRRLERRRMGADPGPGRRRRDEHARGAPSRARELLRALTGPRCRDPERVRPGRLRHHGRDEPARRGHGPLPHRAHRLAAHGAGGAPPRRGRAPAPPRRRGAGRRLPHALARVSPAGDRVAAARGSPRSPT